MNAEAEPRPGYNDHSEHVEISAQDRAVGPKIYDVFTKRFMRPLPWDIVGDEIRVYKPWDKYADMIAVPGEEYKPDTRNRVILTKGLEKEQISPGLASSIDVHKMVEDFLRDFMKDGTATMRNNMGLSMANLQWGREEMQHGLALAMILERTGRKTSEQIKEKYYQTLEHSWVPPFPSEREMVLYACVQEPVTGLNYGGMAKQALAEGAPITASILTLIQEDESYHGSGYIAFGKIYHEEDPEGTLADAIHVAKNFQMPIQNLIPNPRRAISDLRHYAGFNTERIPIGGVQHALKALRFVPDDQIKEVVQGYLKTA